VPALTDNLAAAETLWDAAAALSAHWRANLPAAPARRSRDSSYSFWSTAVRAAAVHFAAQRATDGEHLLSKADRDFIGGAVGDGSDADAVDALVWGMGAAVGGYYVLGWRATLERDGRLPTVRLRDGELIPVDPGPWSARLEHRIPRGDALDRLDPGDHPSVRVFRGVRDGARYEVTISFVHEDDLRSVIGAGEALTLQGLHPNQTDAETPLDEPYEGIRFGVRFGVEHPDVVLSLVDEAMGAPGPITVLPELSTTPELMDEIAARVDGHAGRLVVAGSCHMERDGVRQNVARAFMTDAPAIEHVKLVAFGQELSRGTAPSKEGIDEPDPRKLIVHQAGRWRVAILICKDLLVDNVADMVARLGVNLLLVPAMSPTTEVFSANMERVVAASQAIVWVVNGPLQWGRTSAGPPALMGQPVPGRRVVASAEDTAPSRSAARFPDV
jgi:hypothetical protein